MVTIDPGEWMSCVWPARRYTERFAKYKGMLDAKASLPVQEGERQVVTRLAQAGFRKPGEYRSILDWIRAGQRYMLGYASEIRNAAEQILAECAAKFLRVDKDLRSRQKDLEYRARDAETDLQRFNTLYPYYAAGRSLSLAAYYVVVAAIAIVELPLNVVAFDLFKEERLMTWMVALALAFAIPTVAHWVGAVLKQPWRTASDNRFLFLSIAVVVISLCMIAYLREKFFRNNSTSRLRSLP